VAVKIKLARPRILQGGTKQTALLAAGAAVAIVFIFGFFVFGFYYFKYKHIVDDRLEKPLFANTAKIYAAPREVRPGQKLTPRSLAQELRAAGYSEDGRGSASPLGMFSEAASSITVHPGPQSFHAQDGATIGFNDGLVSQINGDNGQALSAYDLEPMLITGLSEDANRTKRRLVTYDELPKYLVPSVLAIEDRRFFEHGGVNYFRLLEAGLNDIRSGRRQQGGSTLTMQLARGFFLTPEKKIKRKLIEIVITFQLEHRFTKQQIFQMYANQINLGQRGSFAIDGFGEAAQAYFGKDVRQLDLPECALLAGMIQSPSRLNPYKHPERAQERRNVVLDSMVASGAITKEQSEAAKTSPIRLAQQSVDASEAPYFVDLVHDQLTARLGESNYNHEGLRIYTSLDPDLQRAASDAVDIGMKNVDELVTKLRTRHNKKTGETTVTGPITYPQIALIALNPHTGQVLALVGGRNYGVSQFNHAVSHRPTGSIFKPFVYAAAFNTSLSGAELEGQAGVFTPVTLLNDQQTTYTVAGQQDYTPRNFDAQYHDTVTARYALQMSLNNATIALAQMVGFNNVASLARDAGIKSARGTPAVAIGSYDATPLDMAGAYTVFANGGVKIDPWMLASVRSPNGDPIQDFSPDTKPVMDPRVAYLTTSLMENVVNSGTGFEVRRRGFTAPAAGKTGTSHDAWFAGFTSNLLCIVWIGNDDYSDIKVEGAKAAAPIWAEFMKRAVLLPQYSDTKEFVPPQGVVQVRLDKETNLLADSSCPVNYYAAFLDGTEPTDTCSHANGDQRNLFQKIFGLGEKPAAGPAKPGQFLTGPPPVQQPAGAAPVQTTATAQNAPPQQEQPKKKKGFFSKIFGGSSDKKPDQNPPQ
jgi:penicillin-binding protein 1B